MSDPTGPDDAPGLKMREAVRVFEALRRFGLSNEQLCATLNIDPDHELYPFSWWNKQADEVENERERARDTDKWSPDDPWADRDLDELIDGSAQTHEPDALERDDGRFITYLAKVTWIWGEPGHGKTMLSGAHAAQVIKSGRHVMWIDLEGQARDNVEKLLYLFGCDRDEVRERFHLKTPDATLDDATRKRLTAQLERDEYGLVVLDAVNDFISLMGNKPNDVDATAKIDQQLLQMCKRSGAAVEVLDHVTKDSAGRDWPLNSGHKKAVTDVGIRVDRVHAFTRDQAGYSVLRCFKDRQGTWPSDGHVVGYLIVSDGRAWVSVDPPDPRTMVNLPPAEESSKDARDDAMEKVRREMVMNLITSEPDKHKRTSAARELKNRYDGTPGCSSSSFARTIGTMVNLGLIAQHPEGAERAGTLYVRGGEDA